MRMKIAMRISSIVIEVIRTVFFFMKYVLNVINTNKNILITFNQICLNKKKTNKSIQETFNQIFLSKKNANKNI